MSPSTLSKVLKGTRPLPLKLGREIARRLKLSPQQSALFNESVIRKQALLDQIQIQDQLRFVLDESHYRIIAEWEHYAILTLMDVEDFKSDVAWIAKRLGVSVSRVRVVMQNLLQGGLVKEADGVLRKIQKRFRTTDDISSSALRASHEESLELAKKKLEQVEVELRDFTSVTMAIDPSKIQEFKAIIREFNEKASMLSQTGAQTEVYQMSVQFFPLTQVTKRSS